MLHPHPGWLAPIGYMAGILGLSSIPGTSASGDDGKAPLWWLPELVSNLLHIPLYAGLALVWACTLALVARLAPRPAAITASALAAGFGVIDEGYQQFTPGRTAGTGDVLLDAIGAALGSACFLALVHWGWPQRFRGQVW